MNTTEKQILLVTKTIAIACLASMLLSWKLWVSTRHFPTSPVFSFFPSLVYPIDYIVFSITLIVLSSILFLKNPRKAIIVFLFISVLLALWDLNRWQPWYYEYALLFFVLSFYNYTTKNSKHQTAIILCFKLMIAAIYFWSGLQKLNPNFIADTFPWLMEPITSELGVDSLYYLKWLGLAFPLIEMSTGILLVINKVKKIGAILAIFTHLFILFVLGPFGHNYNFVVWPWNIFMIFMNWQLFYKSPAITKNDFRFLNQFYSIKLVLILFVLLPLFNFFNKWDSYLSHNLYSGNTSNGIIHISAQVKKKLPSYIQCYVGNDNEIDIKYWCMKELGVPPYPEKRNYIRVTNTFYNYSTDSSEIYFEFIPKINVKF